MNIKRIFPLLLVLGVLMGCTPTGELAISNQTEESSAPAQTMDSEITAEPDMTDVLCIGAVNAEGYNYYLETIAEAYQKEYPEVTVSVNYYDSVSDLNIDIVGNGGPDILLIDNIPYQSYRAKGLFVNLQNTIPQDAVYPELLNAYTSSDGAIYSFPLSFSLGCLTAAKEVAQDRTGWTLEEFLSSAGDYTGLLYYDVDTLAETLVDMNLDKFIDPETNQASLGNESFYGLLDFLYAAHQAQSQPDGEDNTNWFSFAAPTDYLYVRSQDQALIGWPTPDRTGYLVESSLELAVLSTGQNQGQAKQFLQYCLSQEGQTQNVAYGFPVRQDLCEELWQEALAVEAQATSDLADEDAALQEAASQVEQEDYETFCTLLTRISCVSRRNEAVRQILTDELEPFLSGDKTREETAEIVESRLNIYLAEQS
jgi:ABC-type glycerol-3-phosphate transport system substrate-binding protein